MERMFRKILGHLVLTVVFSLLLANLAGHNVGAEGVVCVDNSDCGIGESCIYDGRLVASLCVKPCAALRLNLETNGSELYTPSDVPARMYKLRISNWRDFPDSFFAASPELPPCGLNANASRSWVDIWDAGADRKIYGFCALTNAEMLTEIWFGVLEEAQPPQEVYVTLEDRQTGVKYCSNTVRILTP